MFSVTVAALGEGAEFLYLRLSYELRFDLSRDVGLDYIRAAPII
jgi:hypothetical protein